MTHTESPEAAGPTSARLVETYGPAGPCDVEDQYPLTPLQQGLFYHLLRNPGGDEYTAQLGLRFHDTDLDRLRADWETLFRRHPVLRTSFGWDGSGEPVQTVRRDTTPPIADVDLRCLPPAEREEQVADFLTQDRARGFEPGDAPPARLALIRLEDDVVHCVWTHHGLLLDGWSTGLLLGELDGLAAGAAPPSAASFRDFVALTRRSDRTRAAEHWSRVLDGFTTAVPVPFAEPREGTGGGVAEVELTAAESARLRAASRELRVPFAVLAQGAWALALSRLSGLDDVVFGMVVSGRSADLPGIEGTIGLLTNTVPVRAGLPGRRTAGGWLRALAARHADTLEAEHSPLAEVRRHAGVPGGQPLFETVLVVQNFPSTGGGSRRVDCVTANETVHYPLVLFVVPGDRLLIRVAYRADRIGPEQASLVARAVRAAFVGLMDLTRVLENIPVLGSLHESRAARALGPARPVRAETVGEAFAAVVRSVPDAPAVIAADRTVSYRELDRATEAVALRLARLGAGPERRIGVLLERSVESVTATVAVLRTGAAFVPLDPSHPPARIARLLVDGGCTAVVTRCGLPEAVVAVIPSGLPVVRVDEADHPMPDSGVRLPSATPGNLAYVVHTSGSTGQPKGVMVDHRAVLNTLWRLTEEFGLDVGDVVAHKVPVAFTDAVFEVLWPLVSGAAVTVLTDEEVRDPMVLCRVLNERGATYTLLVPRQIQAIAEEARRSGGADPLPRLAWAINSAEALPAGFVEEWDAVCRNARIANIYGMTESAIFATEHRWEGGESAPTGRSLIGRPLGNVVTHVANPVLESCPPAVPGELYIGGPGIARGYLGAPGLTAERFIPDPAGPPGSRLYRTGDRVCTLHDGALDYLGRIDDQMKVRGVRLEPGEVETCLRTHPAVRDAAVALHRGRLAAHLAPIGPDRPSPAELRAWAADRLPGQLVPTAWSWQDRLPLTPHGKLDRRALPAPAPPEPVSAAVAPCGPIEEEIAATWQAVLGSGPVGTREDFFELGGDSLLAISVVGRIRTAFPVEYTVGDLFAGPTVAQAAEVVADQLERIADQLVPLLDAPIADQGR